MIRLYRYRLSFKQPFQGSNFVIDKREGLLIQYEKDGMSAWGEASPLPGYSTESLEEVISSAIQVRSSIHKAIDDALHHNNFPFWKPAYFAPPSFGFAVDTLLIDVLARQRKQAFHEVLADCLAVPALSKFKSGATVGVNAVIGTDNPALLLDLGRAFLDQGYATLKIKVGNPQPLVDPLRQLASDPRKPTLRFDANGSWTVDDAENRARILSEFQPEYLEQPFPVGQESQMAQLQAKIDYPLAADESAMEFITRDDLLKLPTAKILILKPALIGGFRQLADCISKVRLSGRNFVLTSLLDGGISRRTVAALAWALGAEDKAHGLATGELIKTDFLPDSQLISRGTYRLPTEIGLGEPSFNIEIELEEISR